MDDDSCGKFIGSLTKYLQSLCHSYVDFDNGVELVGHIYLNVDTGKKIDYVLNESVCKNGANVVKFTSNSYHAQPVEKAKKDTPKKAPDPPKAAEKKKNDEDDVIIVGSEGGRRNRQGTSPLRSQHSSPNQMMRGNVAGQNRLAQAQQAQGNLFRHPRGPNPRVAGPVPRAGGYTYQPRQRLTYPQQPRNFMNMGAGYNPRMRQPHYPQAHGVRGSSPIDTDITFMREEYVAGQPNHRTGAQPGVQQPGYAYQPRGAPPHLPPQQQPQQPTHLAGAQQRYMTPPYTQPHTTTMPGPLTAGPPTSLGAGQQPPPVTSLASAGGPHPPQESAAGSTIFHPSQPTSTSVSGGMPLPNTTHTIFDSGPVMSSDLMTGSQPQSELLVTSATPTTGTDSLTESSEAAPISSSDTSPSTRGPPGVDAQSGLLIGQVWSESAAAPNPPSSESEPSTTADGSLPYSGVSTTPPVTADLSSPSNTTSVTGGNMFDSFNQQPSTSTESHGMHQSPSQHHHNQPASFSSPTHGQAAMAAQNSAGSSSEGDGFSALVSELQAFNQQPGSHSVGNSSQAPSGSGNSGSGSSSNGATPADPFHGSAHPSGTSPGYPTCSSAPGTNTSQDSSADNSANFQHHTTSSLATAEVKRDPGGDIGVNIATSVIHEFTEASAAEAPETFLAPYESGGGGSQGGAGVAQHGGLEAYQKRSGSTSSHSHGTPSPSSSNLVGPESVVIETKPFLHHTSSDYDSGCDTASASTGERLASPQASHSHLRNLSIPLVPVDSPTSSLTLKQERPSEDDTESENVKMATSDWKKTPESDWITNMSALNNSDDSMESSSDTAQDDDDPNYTPGKRFDNEKGTGKRTRSKHTEKVHKGKKRKVDSPDSDGGGEREDHSLNMEVTAEAEDTHQPPYQSPEQLPDLDQPLDTDQHHEDGSQDTVYKPGTFILVNISKDSERSSRTRPAHTPAEVIATPEGQPHQGVWVHTLVPAGNGLWRLPSIDQMVDIHVEPEDIVKTLDHANVRIVGTKVFYKFDDM